MLPPKGETETRYDQLQAPGAKYLLPREVWMGEGRAGCLGATNPAVTLAASGPEASPTICESQCHSSPKRGPSEAAGPACRAAGEGELLGAP